MEETPFPDLSIADFEFLSGLEARERCPHCGRSRMFYCYNCFTALPSLADHLPKVKLPYKVHIIKHPGERCGKSTAVHAAVLASEDVVIFTYPEIPEYTDTVRAVLVFPGDNSVTLNNYVQAMKTGKPSCCPVAGNGNTTTVSPGVPEDFKEPGTQTTKPGNPLSNSQDCLNNCAIEDEENIENQLSDGSEPVPKQSKTEVQETCILYSSQKHNNDVNDAILSQQTHLDNTAAGRSFNSGSSIQSSNSLIDIVVFIDSTWFQVHKISIDPRLSKLQRIELTSHETKFWRPQLDKPSTYLSTIEAIYYCAREYHDNCSEVPYGGQYDNLLFFFCYFYQKIKNLTSKTGKKLKAYHQERRKKPKTLPAVGTTV